MRRPFPPRTLAAVLTGGAIVATMTLTTVGASAQAGQSQTEAELQRERETLLQRLARLEAELAEVRSASVRAVQEQRARAEAALVRAQREREQVVAERRKAAEVALRAAQERERRRWHAMPRLRFSGVPWRSGGSIDWILTQAEELELTDEQMERLRDARRAHRRSEIERDAAIEVAELDLAELLEDEYAADLAAVQQALETISSLRVEERIADLRLKQDSYAVLTPEQREQLDEMRPRGLRGVLLRRDREEGPAAYWFDDDDPSFLELDHAFGELDGAPFGRFELAPLPFGTFELHELDAFGLDDDARFRGLWDLLRDRHDDRRDEDEGLDESGDEDQGAERSSRRATADAEPPVASATF